MNKRRLYTMRLEGFVPRVGVVQECYMFSARNVKEAVDLAYSLWVTEYEYEPDTVKVVGSGCDYRRA